MCQFQYLKAVDPWSYIIAMVLPLPITRTGCMEMVRPWQCRTKGPLSLHNQEIYFFFSNIVHHCLILQIFLQFNIQEDIPYVLLFRARGQMFPPSPTSTLTYYRCVCLAVGSNMTAKKCII